MIDLKKGGPGYKGFIAGEVLLVAAVVAIGLLTWAQPAGQGMNGGSQKGPETEAEAPSEEENASAVTTALPTEKAAETEPGTEDGNETAAYAKVKEDAEYVSDVITPGGNEMYSEKELMLVNPWHLIPEDYEPELEYVEYGHRMDECAAGHLQDMLDDCRAEGLSPLICSSYRERSKQERLFENDVRRFMYSGMTEEEAIAETARNVAVPGSSEHEAGLAVDIVYSRYQVLNESQEDNETQQWLMEHCWEYGFILRYPYDKQDITGITYEPWHYRYVGREAAEEIMSRGICLEEYLGVIDADTDEDLGEYGDPEGYEDSEGSEDLDDEDA